MLMASSHDCLQNLVLCPSFHSADHCFNLRSVCGMHRLVFEEPGLNALLLPGRAELLTAIEAEEADRARRASQEFPPLNRGFPLAWEFDSVLSVRLLSLLAPPS
jgi:hypothetical protein